MTLLINEQIRSLLGDSIIISPFNEEMLNTNSYDLTIGPFIARYPFWRKGAIALNADAHELSLEDARKSDGIIHLAPLESILAHSLEFVGGTVSKFGYHAVTTSLRATSTAGRLRLTACGCAGLGDVGYVNRYTFEVMNLRPDQAVSFAVGSVIGQMEFHLVAVPPNETLYGQPGKGSYQNGLDLEAIMKDWRPEMMLPQKLKVKEWAREYADTLPDFLATSGPLSR